MSTYTPIASQTTTGTTALISFTNVPQTYQDLVLVCQSKISTSFADIGLQFNNDTGANYADVLIVGYVSTAAGGVHNNANFLRGWYLSSSETYTMINLMDYRNTTNYKQVIGRSATVSANEIEVAAGSYRSTSPITTITLTPQAANFLANSTFNLYGIASGGGYALGGDIVTTDGTYWYHTFLSSGAFTPTKALTVDYLVVAGGAGGGDDNAGGGGAGGLRSTVTATGGGGSLETALSVTAQAYAVTVGAGGAGATINGNRGVNGSDSVFSTITSTGGGGGGGDTSGQRTGANGGSGGGGAGNSASVGGTGTRTTNSNQWTHIYVSQSTAQTAIYVNGVLDVAQSDTVARTMTLNRLSLGAYFRVTAANFYAGRADDARVYNVVHTPSEVYQMWRDGRHSGLRSKRWRSAFEGVTGGNRRRRLICGGLT